MIGVTDLKRIKNYVVEVVKGLLAIVSSQLSAVDVDWM